MKKMLLHLLSALIVGAAGAVLTKQKDKKIIRQKEARIDKFYDYFQLTNRWLKLRNQGKSLSTFFMNQKCSSIAIYGIGEMGSRLYEELHAAGMKVSYVIDQKSACAYPLLPVYEMEEELPYADVIVVTPLFAYQEVKEQLMRRYDYPVISLSEVIYESE